ncbi:MAG: hypothetical protein J3K34DRAFT_380210 [Monoraphidium minutum]|nr:MAG: hypothetical protein J3K34DRAFT_380210 [Monoraphidium minutum]
MAATSVPVPQYHTDLRAPVTTVVGPEPHAKVHRSEIIKVRQGLPVEINPSVGDGFKVMDWAEYFGRFKASAEFPECLACSSANTKEHYFTQTWCRGKRVWECESVCLDCLQYSFRAYRDPDFQTPEEFEKARWTALVAEQAQRA